MYIIEFFYDNPFLATLITLAYAAVVGVFVYIMIQIYRKH